MIKEGEKYLFLIEKEIFDPLLGHKLILSYKNKERYSLDLEYYVKYNLVVGKKISCRVDKINCTGQVFLEPEHPIYIPGNIYTFKVKSVKSDVLKGIDIITVVDVFDNNIDIAIPSENTDKKTSEIQFKVSSIRKGIPILEQTLLTFNCTNLKNGMSIIVEFIGIVTQNNDDFYWFKYKTCYAVLKVKHYAHYGFKIGEKIECTFIDIRPNGFLKIEPLNPFYKVGNIYEFIIEKISTENSISKSNCIAEVYDIFGKKCSVLLPINTYNKGEKILCEITGYKKGRPLLKSRP
ncbi:MAG: hypothetical protein H6537_01315 [Bacteroidales bacterium]|nr:hypothetical protein [Bacteroidales bacterium]